MLHKTDGISLTVFGSFLRTFAANSCVCPLCLQHAKCNNKGEITSVHKTEKSGTLEFCLLIRSNSFFWIVIFSMITVLMPHTQLWNSLRKENILAKLFEKRICTTSYIKQYTLYKCKSSQLSHKTLFESLMVLQ